MASGQETILVIDDSEAIRVKLQAQLRSLGYQVVLAETGRNGLNAISQHHPHLILLDYQLPDTTGLDLLRKLRTDGNTVPILLMTAEGSERIAVTAFKMGVRDYLIKPFEPQDVAQAIDRALREWRLQREKEILLGQLQGQVRQLTVLHRVGKAVTAQLDASNLLERIVEASVFLSNADEGFVQLIDDNQLVVRASHNINPLHLRELSKHTDYELATRTIKTNKPIRINSERDGIRVQANYLAQAVLMVPLLVGTEALGVLTVAATTHRRNFDEGDERLMQMLADYASIALHNARTYSTLRETQGRLVEAEKLSGMGRMAASLAHEINNPLAIIRSGLELVAQQHTPGSALGDLVQGLDEEVARIARLLYTLVNFYQPNNDGVPPDLNHLIISLMHITKPQLDKANVKLYQELATDLPAPNISSDACKQVLINLVRNAIDAMPDGGKLTIRSAHQKGQIFINVEDTGIGIPPEHRERIFEPFFSTKGVTGTGLGLSVVYGILQQVGGAISVESTVDKGSNFTLRIPVAAQRSQSPDLDSDELLIG
ncbi:hybrid sensor histidine kinase/response regulator [Herpetosiphon llansteffanensis]|uniref:hybrid sensor histidine kinase/response regulator n=1 Tax=Herpetosiphon llansteffanensis TaxID=2094568 RepID=UPI000D7BDA5D|nr:response regulator [Herpetosiphon llansteffanensis]